MKKVLSKGKVIIRVLSKFPRSIPSYLFPDHDPFSHSKVFEVLVTAVQRGSAGHPHPILTLIMHKLTRRNSSAAAVHGLLQVMTRYIVCDHV